MTMPMANARELDRRSPVQCAICHVLSDCICEAAPWRIEGENAAKQAAKRDLRNENRRLARRRKKCLKEFRQRIAARKDRFREWEAVMLSGWTP